MIFENLSFARKQIELKIIILDKIIKVGNGLLGKKIWRGKPWRALVVWAWLHK